MLGIQNITEEKCPDPVLFPITLDTIRQNYKPSETTSTTIIIPASSWFKTWQWMTSGPVNLSVMKRICKTDRQTMLVYFTWPTKRPGGHQSQLTMGYRNIF